MSTSEGAGPESEQCVKLIEAHKECLRSEGFKVGFSSPFLSACSNHIYTTRPERFLVPLSPKEQSLSQAPEQQCPSKGSMQARHRQQT